MSKIEKIDSNFEPATVGDRAVNYYNVVNKPFSLEGFPFGEHLKGEFYRLPDTLKAPEDINNGALWNSHYWASGGCIRFRSNATFICIRATLANSTEMDHMPRTGSSGFDIYVGRFGEECHHVGTAGPQPGEIDFERTIFEKDNWSNEMRDWCVNFPLYGGASKVEIGIPPEAQIEPPMPHARKPILFYGSSITQGGCASRPGNNYCSMLCREVDAEQINLGFSGCGKGEKAIAKIIATFDLSAFIFDYDHNASSPEELEATHEQFFKIVREAQPNLPIIMMSKCNIWRDRNYEVDSKRREVIRKTYENALAAGDKNVYFIDGETLFGDKNREACTVDTVHPNDLGFYRMYEVVLPVLKKALSK